MAPKIIGLFPGHECYVEPFAGGAGVLLAKPRSRLEVYNDLDGDMVNLFQVLRDRPAELSDAVALTPFAREEFEAAFAETDDPIERARRVLVRSHFAHGSLGIHAGSARSTGFRAAGMRAGTLPCHLWSRLHEVVAETADRMRGVVIENRPAIDVMLASDGPNTLHYVDPPYLHETRTSHKFYRHEMSDDQHRHLLSKLRDLVGHVVLSGYASEMYDSALRDWRRIEVKERADRSSERTEVIWCNFDDVAPLFQTSN